MLKIIIKVKDNNDNNSCKVDVEVPKDLSKASEVEKRAGAIVFNEISLALEKIKLMEGE